MTVSVAAKFPLRWALLWAIVIGAVYGIPQALHAWHTRAPNVLLEENLDEISYAVFAARAANIYPQQPEPYQVNNNVKLPVSFSNVQWLPAWTTGWLARVTRTSVPAVMWASSFVLPALVGFFFLMMAWYCGIRERWALALCAIFSVLMFPPVLWWMQFRYMQSWWHDQYPGFRLYLPHSRRTQPQFTMVAHYLAIAFSLLALHVKNKRQSWLAALAAGGAFGASFYCYFFSWSVLLGWFVLGALVVWHWQRERLNVWLAACGTGLLLAIPYAWLLVSHFGDISSSAASAKTRAFPQDPAIAVTLVICVIAALAWLVASKWNDAPRLAWWVPLVLNLVAVMGALQNVLTGMYIQPYHYLHYFARPTTNFALVALWFWLSERWLRNARWRVGLNIAAVTVCLLAAALFQWARYRDVRSLEQAAINAQPAMQAVRQFVTPGALIYSPDETAREIVPLYTSAASFFSLYMMVNETPRTRVATQERIAVMQWLKGATDSTFAEWLRGRPLDVYFQHLQRRIDAQSEARMDEIAAQLREAFANLQQGQRPDALVSLRYALLPTTTKLESTRLTAIFQCRQLWADEHYVLYALQKL